MKSIDPDTGLELTELKPTPTMRRLDGPMFDPNTPTPPAPMQPTQAPAIADPRDVGGGKNRPAGKVSVLDGVLFALMGKPVQMQDEQERRESSRKRNEAGNLAAAAAEGDPGSQFMGTPSGGGGDLRSTVSNLVRLFAGGGG